MKGQSDVLVLRWNMGLILYFKRYVCWLFIEQSNLLSSIAAVPCSCLLCHICRKINPPAFPLICCETLDKLLNFLIPNFLTCKMINNRTCSVKRM